MKKLLSILISMFVMITGFNVNSSILSQNQINRSHSYLLTKDSENRNDFNINILNRLPNKVIKKIYDRKFRIKLQNNVIQIKSNENIGKLTLAQGITDYNTNTITVAYYKEDKHCKDILFKDTNKITTLHEIGHLWDSDQYGCSRFSIKAGKDVLKSIREKEAINLLNTKNFSCSSDNYLKYFRDYSQEYYAECFALYFLNTQSNNILKNSAPMTYKYIENTLK